MKKTIILGVTGCIAAYKACEIVSRFIKLGYDVRVIMTENATEFVAPLSFETLSLNRVVINTFDKNREFETEHISYAKLASAFLVAPATANVIGKIASGIADDMLTTTILATKAPIFICPAMNTNMYENPVVQQNIQALKDKGYNIIDPIEGRLACGDIGKGKMAEPIDIVSEIDRFLMPSSDLRGRNFLVTAGATEEKLDGVRFLTNKSSGKMGIAIAEAAQERGANVTLIAGRISIPVPVGIKTIRVQSTEEMFVKVKEEMGEADVIIKAAAPADYKPISISKEKIKDEKITLELIKNPDIAKYVGEHKDNRLLVVFAAETSNLVENASNKLKTKNADLIVANDVTMEGAGFDVDTNIATIIRRDGIIVSLEKMKKTELANIIIDNLLELS